jgi:hypothetical protein
MMEESTSRSTRRSKLFYEDVGALVGDDVGKLVGPLVGLDFSAWANNIGEFADEVRR